MAKYVYDVYGWPTGTILQCTCGATAVQWDGASLDNGWDGHKCPACYRKEQAVRIQPALDAADALIKERVKAKMLADGWSPELVEDILG